MLSAAFRGWVQFWMWNQGVRTAYELDYATIKHSLDLKRLGTTVRETNERKAHGVTEDYGSGGPKYRGLAGGGARKPPVPRSLHQRHVARPVKCRHCAALYLESQNHAVVCAFHPGEYKAACPVRGRRSRSLALSLSRSR